MELKTKKCLLISYIEGIALVGLILVMAYWKGDYSIDLLSLPFIFATPIIMLLLEKISPKMIWSASATAGMMGGLTIIFLLPGFWEGLFWGLISFFLFRFIFSRINNEPFFSKQRR